MAFWGSQAEVRGVIEKRETGQWLAAEPSLATQLPGWPSNHYPPKTGASC